MKDAAAIVIFIPSDEVGNQGCASPLILGGPASPSGSGEGFLFLAARAPINTGLERRKMLQKYNYTNVRAEGKVRGSTVMPSIQR